MLLMSENPVPVTHSLKKKKKSITSWEQLQLMTCIFQGIFNLITLQCNRSWQSLEPEVVVLYLCQEGGV